MEKEIGAEDVVSQVEMNTQEVGFLLMLVIGMINHQRLRLENLVVENNNAMYGGGVFVRKANLEMDNCIIRDNHTYNDQSHNRNGMGGALFMMHAQSNLPSKIKNTRFETNTAHEGGAVLLWQNSWGDHRVEFENVMINGNTSSLYSGVRAMDAKFSLMNSTIVDNHTTQGLNDGAGIHASNWSTGRIVNSIIHNNYPYNLSVGGVDGNYDSLLVSNSIVEHGSDSIQVFQNGFVDWQNSNLNVAPDLADDFGFLTIQLELEKAAHLVRFMDGAIRHLIMILMVGPDQIPRIKS